MLPGERTCGLRLSFRGRIWNGAQQKSMSHRMWKPPAAPAGEAERLNELYSYAILDTPAEERFDRITRIASRVYGADAAYMSFVDADQQWVKAQTGRRLPDTLPRSESLCTMVIAENSEVVIEDLKAEPALAGHPVVEAGIWGFYAGVPLRGEHGHVIGTLCIVNAKAGAPEAFKTDVLHDLAAISSHELILAQRNAELYRQTNTDALTGLANRRMFDSELTRTLRRSRRTGGEASLLVIDLDHFKEVNDTAGHPAGDAALAAFASVLKPIARRPDDLAARIGGEEFALVLSGTDAPGAETVALSLLDALADAGIAHPKRGRLTTSIGAAALQPGDDVGTWFTRADRALYAAKADGRATVRTA